MKKLKPKNKSIQKQENFNEIIGLLIEANMLLNINMNENGILDMDELDEDYLFSKDSVCGKLLNRDDFSETKNEDRLIERLIMHVLVPEIVRRYNEEHHDKRSNRSGINDFFEDLDYEDNKYDLTRIKEDYGITAHTVTRGYDNDLFMDRGKPTYKGSYIWRQKPKTT